MMRGMTGSQPPCFLTLPLRRGVSSPSRLLRHVSVGMERPLRETSPSRLRLPHPHTSGIPQIVDAYAGKSCADQQPLEEIQMARGIEEVPRCVAEDQIMVLPLFTCVYARLLLTLPVAKERLHDKGRKHHLALTLLCLGSPHTILACNKDNRAS